MLKLFRLLVWLAATAFAVALLLAGATDWLDRDARAPGPLAAAKTLVVAPHSGLAGIAEQLARQGIIRRKVAFEALAVLSGRRHQLHPGEYAFPPAATAAEALAMIAAGRTVRHKLTIPEGLTSAEIVARVAAAPALAGDPGPVPPDGSLYPATYVYSYGDSRRKLIERMQRDMAQIVGKLWQERAPGLPLASPEQAVALASIVEKETAVSAERAHVAGVYINRLRLGMRLDADPTVLFALEDDGKTRLGRPLDHADLATASPYNTYRVAGLPPGPIDTPGRAALGAALQPATTADLYFVADGSGGHVFARTLAEQTQNIALYRHGTPPASVAAPPDAGAATAPAPPKPVAPPEGIAGAGSGSAKVPPVPPEKPAVPAAERTAAAALHHPCRPQPSHPCPPRLR